MKKIFIPVLFGLLAASCTTLYHPQLESIPLVEEKGELALEAGLSHQDAFAGNISASYGLTDKVALQGFARTNQGSEGRNFHGQLAAGLYDKTEKGLIREAYAGVAAGINSAKWGTGRADMVDAEGNPMSYVDAFDDVVTYTSAFDENYAGNYQMAFVQGNIGKRKEHWEWAFGLKLGGMHTLINHREGNYLYTETDVPTDNGVADVYDYTENPFRADGKAYSNLSLLLQPQLELRFGWEHFKFTWRMAYGMFFGLPSDINRTFMGHYNSGLGIMYRF